MEWYNKDDIEELIFNDKENVIGIKFVNGVKVFVQEIKKEKVDTDCLEYVGGVYPKSNVDNLINLSLYWYNYPHDLMYMHIKALITNNRDVFKKYSKKEDIKKNLYNVQYITNPE